MFMKIPNNWKQQTLERLENTNWGNPAEAPTGLVKRCLELTKTPLEHFTASDVRIMIEQKTGLFFMVKLAIELLEEAIFIEADYFKGDLLQAVFNIDIEFWNDHGNFWKTINAMTRTKPEEIKKHNISYADFYKTIYCNFN